MFIWCYVGSMVILKLLYWKDYIKIEKDVLEVLFVLVFSLLSFFSLEV